MVLFSLLYFEWCGKKRIRELLKEWKMILIGLQIDGYRSLVFCLWIILFILWRILGTVLIS